MNGYLERLAARSLGVAPAIRPRAPAVVMDERPAEATPDEETPDTESRPARMRAAAITTPHAGRRVGEEAPLVTRERHRALLHRGLPAQQDADLVADSANGTSGSTHEAPLVPTSPPRSTPTALFPAREGAYEHAAALPVASFAATPPARAEPLARSGQPVSQTAFPTAQSVAIELTAPAVNDEPAPVEIRIGRIEIVAPPPEPVTSRPGRGISPTRRPEHAPMSLGEYFKRRRGGRP